MKPTPDNLAISGGVEQVEIFELDDRLELAADPLFQLGDCCGNSGCICPDQPGE